MSTTTPTPHLLIDVRSASEFQTGFLTLPASLQNPSSSPSQHPSASSSPSSPPTLNIPHTHITTLPSILTAQNIPFTPQTQITLYCRSGRRSDIAARELRGMGFENVRDVGGFEEAREWVEAQGREGESGRIGEREERGDVVQGDEGIGIGKGAGLGRSRGFEELVAGLRELDGV